MSSTENQVCNGDDGKLEDKPKEGQQESGTPPVPMIPDDDIDDDDENFPLITSVFSLASSDETESPEKKTSSKKEPPKEVTSPEVTSQSKASPRSSPNGNDKVCSSSFRVNPQSAVATHTNSPFYVGKGKLLLPKTEESKVKIPPQAPGMTFSKMFSIQPITTSATTTSTSDNSNAGTGMLTRSALKKVDAPATSAEGTGSKVSTNITSGSNGPMVNLATTLPFLNIKSATTQIAVPPMNTAQANMLPPSVLGSTKPLMQMVKRIVVPTTTNTATQSQGNVVVKSPVNSPVASPKMPITTKSQLQKPRHVNIAPAPSNTSHFVMVPKTLSTPTATKQIVTTSSTSGNLPRVVMVPKQNNSKSVSPGQLMYLIENKTADGKTYRFLIPTDAAKIITNSTTGAKTSTVVSPSAPVPAAPNPAGPTQAVSAAAPVVQTTSPASLIRIIPKPAQTVVAQVPKTPPTATVSAASPSNVVAGVKSVAANTIVSTARPVVLNTGTPSPVAGNITPPGSTSPTLNAVNMTSPITEEEAINTPPTSPAPAEESPTSDDSMDTGLSPHEARIQKLKELLRKQEDAVDRLRQKRKKEIDDIRASPAATTPSIGSNIESNKKDDSPFVVPLPPKKARYEQYRRNKQKETSTQTSKDGFLPNTDDTQFVKLVGLEKVVDKLKAKKILELNENKIAE